jgi:hypothetical protein
MIFYHHDLKIELDDAWWAEAQMAGCTRIGYGLPQSSDVSGARWHFAFVPTPDLPLAETTAAFQR